MVTCQVKGSREVEGLVGARVEFSVRHDTKWDVDYEWAWSGDEGAPQSLYRRDIRGREINAVFFLDDAMMTVLMLETRDNALIVSVGEEEGRAS